MPTANDAPMTKTVITATIFASRTFFGSGVSPAARALRALTRITTAHTKKNRAMRETVLTTSSAWQAPRVAARERPGEGPAPRASRKARTRDRPTYEAARIRERYSLLRWLQVASHTNCPSWQC
jgi:hypothetical protein